VTAPAGPANGREGRWHQSLSITGVIKLDDTPGTEALQAGASANLAIEQVINGLYTWDRDSEQPLVSGASGSTANRAQWI